MKHIAVVAILGLIVLNAVFKVLVDPITAAIAGVKQQQTKMVELEFEQQLALPPTRRIKREHTGKAQSFIDLILKIMNSLQFYKPNIAKGGQKNYIYSLN